MLLSETYTKCREYGRVEGAREQGVRAHGGVLAEHASEEGGLSAAHFEPVRIRLLSLVMVSQRVELRGGQWCDCGV